MDREGSEGRLEQTDAPRADESTKPPDTDQSGAPSHATRDLIPREYLRLITVWSLVPSYALAGGLLGYAADRWLHTFPYLTALGLLLALVLAVRDMYRMRDVM